MTSFKELLEEKRTNRGTRKGADAMVSVKALGECAVAEIHKLMCYAPIYPVTLDIYKEIAEACLGREEVMKRLEELSK